MIKDLSSDSGEGNSKTAKNENLHQIIPKENMDSVKSILKDQRSSTGMQKNSQTVKDDTIPNNGQVEIQEVEENQTNAQSQRTW